MTRTFRASRRSVYEAWTQPGQVASWYVPEGWTMPACLIDLRAGGTWSYVLKGPDESLISMTGSYLEVASGARLVYTESVEGTPGETLNTVTLAERDGLTELTAVVRYSGLETREAVLASGLPAGAGASLDRLDDFLAAPRSRRGP